MQPDEWRAILSGAAVVISIVSVLFTLREKRRQKHATLISALQGEKEAVAFIAFQLRNHSWGGRRSDRLELLSALVVAWIFEKSDRARAMVHSALKAVYVDHESDVRQTIDDTQDQLTNYVQSHYVDEAERDRRVGKYLEKLSGLKVALDRSNGSSTAP